jgi:hypothetical protein
MVPTMAFVIAAIVALPLGASAQVIQGEQDRYKSPQRFACELRFGPYKPDIDSEFGGRTTPYRDFFGSSRRLMSQIELDYQIIRHVGTAGIGLGVGYFSESGNNRLASTGAPSADTTSLKLIPFSLSAVYRFDLLLERMRIPLVPYGKLGLDYVIWSINNGNGEVPEDPTGGVGRGGTWGWHAAVGLSLTLDFFDPTSAHQFDVEMGVNHTHLFVELGHWDVSGLGAAHKLHVGDNTWMAGLLFEF